MVEGTPIKEDDSLFEEYLDKSSFLKSIEPLTETFMPSRIPQRITQRRELLDNYTCLFGGSGVPKNQLHYGMSGTGKTTAIRITLPTLEKLVKKKNPSLKLYILYISGIDRSNLKGQYVSEINRTLGLSLKKTSDYNEFFGAITNKLQGTKTHIIFIVDDYHQFDKNQRKTIITQHFLLSEKIHTSTLYVSNRPLYSLKVNEPEIFSRFDPQLIEYDPYNHKELREILNQRIEQAFRMPKLFPKDIKERIVNAVEPTGNARKIIDILRLCSTQYGKKGNINFDKAITDAFTKHELSIFAKMKDSQIITLSPFLNIDVSNDPYIPFDELLELYNTILKKQGLMPLGRSTFHYNLTKFEELELIDKQIVKGKSKYKLKLEKSIISNTILDTLEKMGKPEGND